MNDQAGTSKLLDRCDVALDAVARENVYLAAPVTRIYGLDTALRTRRAHGAKKVSRHRVSPSEKPEMEQRRLRYCILRSLHRDALQDCFHQEMGDKGTGIGRYLLSEAYGVSR